MMNHILQYEHFVLDICQIYIKKIRMDHFITNNIFWLFVERSDDELEGILIRKHEWESTTKKASNR